MSEVNLVIKLVRELEARAKTKEAHLINGGCADFTEYKTTVAHHQALVQTIAYIKELAKEANE